jgi:hypothetical protein
MSNKAAQMSEMFKLGRLCVTYPRFTGTEDWTTENVMLSNLKLPSFIVSEQP